MVNGWKTRCRPQLFSLSIANSIFKLRLTLELILVLILVLVLILILELILYSYCNNYFDNKV